MRYLKEILVRNRFLTVIFIFTGIFNSFMANYKADYFQRVVDGMTDGSATLNVIAFYGGILIINYIMNYLEEYPSKKLEQGIYLDFKLLSLEKAARIDYAAYQTVGTGKMTQRIENGADAGRNILFNFWLRLFRQLIPTIIFSIYFIWRINHVITYAILAGYIIVFAVTNLLLKFLYRIKERILVNEELLNHFIVRGFMEMVVFRMERQFPGELGKAYAARNEIVNSKAKMNMLHEAFFTIFALLVAVLDAGILIYAWYGRSVSVGEVVSLISLIDNAYTPVAVFNVLYVQYKLDKAAFKRFEGFLNQPDDMQLYSGKTVSNADGDLMIKNLSFGYGEHSIFSGLDLTVKKGEKVAFVGESGSGKSTLVKLLCGLLKYQDGSIQLGGQELNELSLDSLYERISYIPQDSSVFDGTVSENLVFGRKYSEDEQLEVLSEVRLAQLMGNMEAGLDTEIGERGVMLSGGEKQRLALARLWFEKREITILDEATSAMDNITEEAVISKVINLLDDKTVIAVIHRLSSVTYFDRIIVFRNGKIAGQGSFEELMEENQYFADLYNAGSGV